MVWRLIVVKLIYCICRKPGLSRDRFLRYWAEVHAPIGARIPGLRKLVHSYAAADHLTGAVSASALKELASTLSIHCTPIT